MLVPVHLDKLDKDGKLLYRILYDRDIVCVYHPTCLYDERRGIDAALLTIV